ncbi:MAG TPA: D-2-hydroxyacid dehydrogenase [Vicinamibacterales bacterium]|nr:D-2-hydroxyacid dehydrogenase [Vicinamibacterales bacterium]
MKALVAIYSPFASWCIPEAQVEWLRREFPRHTFIRADSDDQTLARIGDAEVVFGATVRCDQLAAARQLRWIHSPAAGIGNMLFPEMIASPIVMTNSRGNSAATIAEHTVGVTLAMLRDLPLAMRRQAQRVWAQDEFNSGARIKMLRDCRVLIVGFGSIGREVGRLMSALGAAVTGIRRSIPSDLHAELAAADIVVISAPQTKETLHMIGAAELASMKDGALIVNVSRGKLIDEAALARALETGRLRGAALDVFEHEPLAPASPLWAREDVFITPHVSGFQARHWPDATALFASNLRRFEAGQPLVNVVDKAVGY